MSTKKTDKVGQGRQDFDWLPLMAVRPWLKNPRKNEPAVGPVAESIKRFGFVAPICVWPSANRMVAGHTRVKALAALLREDPNFVPRSAPGPGLVPVRFHEFGGEEEADAYALADNRLSEIAQWDYAALPEVLRAVGQHDQSLLQVLGWEAVDLGRILGPQSNELPPGADGKEFDESAADDVEYHECPACHHRWPK